MKHLVSFTLDSEQEAHFNDDADCSALACSSKLFCSVAVGALLCIACSVVVGALPYIACSVVAVALL